MIHPPLGVSVLGWLQLLIKKRFSKTVIVRDCVIALHIASALELWRSETYSTKEPETLDWIDTFSPDDLMFDVGANVGLYSLYAGKRGNTVYSFEPEAQNFASLNRNIIGNALPDVHAYCVALSEQERFDLLHISGLVSGDSQHNLGEKNKLFPRESAGTQGVFSSTLDELCFSHGFPIPQHIKIDVDGLEDQIIQGGKQVLAHANFKSLLIEVAGHDGQTPETFSNLRALGLYPVSSARREYRSGSVWARNYIFRRQPS